MKNDIYPCLLFDTQALEAAEFYCSIFRDSEIIDNTPMVVTFTLDSYRIMALNGGAQYKFTEAMSLVVGCDTQEEIDYYWSKLTQGGEEGMCGWLKDKYGVSWQVVPKILGELLKDPDRSPRVVQALNQMIKFDIEALKRA
jgi:predicted 3-demethylubiquinone-9 3-methyltransferase (glyoxalase superfamily)